MPEKVNGNKFSGKSNIASLNSGNTSIDSKSAVQLNSTEQKLATLQKMADNSPYSQRFSHLTSLGNNNIHNQPVSQLSKDSHSLPDNVKQGVESLSGISMDDVKVHYNSAKPAQLNAHAYAQGTDIHLASGQEKHLPHEAWHVVQQKQGRVQPTTMMKAKVPINDDAGLEKEADVMGARALQMKSFSLSDYKTEKSFQRKEIIQRVLETIPEDKGVNSFGLRGKIDGDQDAKDDAKSAVEEPINIEAINITKLKFNFAGSGESVWKTHREKNDKDGKRIEGFKDVQHEWGGKKMQKEKDYLGGKSMVFEYAGPINTIVGVARGAYDSGNNSTAKNLEDAQITLEDSLQKLENFVGHSDFVINMDIKGFSRGAATASIFATWAKSSKWAENLDINLLLIDPVDGHKISAEMPSEANVSTVYDDKKPDTTGTTLMMPLKSNWENLTYTFTPQKIMGYQRLIIITGTKAKHSFGLGEDEESTLHWNGKEVKGMQLTKLPKGMFTVNSDKQPLTIKQLGKNDLSAWYKKRLMREAVHGEERHKVLTRAWNVELKKYIK